MEIIQAPLDKGARPLWQQNGVLTQPFTKGADMKSMGEAAFFIRDDPNAKRETREVVEHQGRLWLVLSYFESLSSGKQYPAELVPMEKLDHAVLSPGRYVLASPLPKQLLYGHVPPEVLGEFAVVQVLPPTPDLPRGPSSIH